MCEKRQHPHARTTHISAQFLSFQPSPSSFPLFSHPQNPAQVAELTSTPPTRKTENRRTLPFFQTSKNPSLTLRLLAVSASLRLILFVIVRGHVIRLSRTYSVPHPKNFPLFPTLGTRPPSLPFCVLCVLSWLKIFPFDSAIMDRSYKTPILFSCVSWSTSSLSLLRLLCLFAAKFSSSRSGYPVKKSSPILGFVSRRGQKRRYGNTFYHRIPKVLNLCTSCRAYIKPIHPKNRKRKPHSFFQPLEHARRPFPFAFYAFSRG